jgi:hypothetical protein
VRSEVLLMVLRSLPCSPPLQESRVYFKMQYAAVTSAYGFLLRKEIFCLKSQSSTPTFPQSHRIRDFSGGFLSSDPKMLAKEPGKVVHTVIPHSEG